MDEQRLKAFEDMLSAILKQYGDTTEKMAKIKTEREGEDRHQPSAFR